MVAGSIRIANPRNAWPLTSPCSITPGMPSSGLTARRVFHANPAFNGLFGYKGDEVLGQRIDALLGPGEAEPSYFGQCFTG